MVLLVRTLPKSKTKFQTSPPPPPLSMCGVESKKLTSLARVSFSAGSAGSVFPLGKLNIANSARWTVDQVW